MPRRVWAVRAGERRRCWWGFGGGVEGFWTRRGELCRRRQRIRGWREWGFVSAAAWIRRGLQSRAWRGTLNALEREGEISWGELVS